MTNQATPIKQANAPTLPPSRGIDPVLRKPQLLEIVPLSYATIRRKIINGEFPKPIRLGANSVGWRQSDVLQWITNLKETELSQS